MKLSWKKELAGILCLLLALAVFIAGASAVLLPKRYDTGSVWGMYRAEPKNSVDVLFLGSSVAYCNVIPAVLYEETGLTSFVMAGQTQTLPVTYRYLRQACKTQSPKVVFIEATGLLFERYNSSVKVNLIYMPWSADRVIPTMEEVPENERPGLLFPLYAYHNRWDQVTVADFKDGLLGYDTDPWAGYLFLDRAITVEKITPDPYEHSEEIFNKVNIDYAEKIISFCREKGIRPIFFLAPNAAPPTEKWQADLRSSLEHRGAEFWNYAENMEQTIDQLQLDTETDFFDELHFNYRGAEKFTRRLAADLAEAGFVPQGEEDTALWQSRLEHYRTERTKWDGQALRPNLSQTASN